MEYFFLSLLAFICDSGRKQLLGWLGGRKHISDTAQLTARCFSAPLPRTTQTKELNFIYFACSLSRNEKFSLRFQKPSAEAPQPRTNLQHLRFNVIGREDGPITTSADARHF